MTSLARAERARLCAAAEAAGPDAPTLCGGWDVLDLLAHLVVREGDALGAPGIAVAPLAGLTERAVQRVRRRGFAAALERVRRPPAWSPARVPALDRLLNTVEMFVHHEDVRRAGASWEPRRLTDPERDQLWRAVALPAKGLVRPAGVPVTVRWAGTDRTHVLRAGDDAVTVTGEPEELVVWLYGRGRHEELSYDGPQHAVDRVRGARFRA